MVICKNCGKYFNYQWEWRFFTYGAFQECTYCRSTTFISSHNFWRVFKWKNSILIIVIEMILAPIFLFILYPARIIDIVDLPFKDTLSQISSVTVYLTVFGVFVVVWILNLGPLIKNKSNIEKSYNNSLI